MVRDVSTFQEHKRVFEKMWLGFLKYQVFSGSLCILLCPDVAGVDTGPLGIPQWAAMGKQTYFKVQMSKDEITRQH